MNDRSVLYRYRSSCDLRIKHNACLIDDRLFSLVHNDDCTLDVGRYRLFSLLHDDDCTLDVGRSSLLHRSSNNTIAVAALTREASDGCTNSWVLHLNALP